jgi:uncharacterized protein
LSIPAGPIRRLDEGGRPTVDMEVSRMGNKIVHAEVVGKDGAALHRFWGGVFGWKQKTDLPGGYAMTDPAESGIVMGTGPSPDGGAGWVTFYISVPDLDETIARVQAAGGSVVMPKFSPAPETWLAMIADPEGHVVGLSQAAA